MKPTVGRIVHFHHNINAYPDSPRKTPEILKAYAAIITDVRETVALLDKGKDVASEKALEVSLYVFAIDGHQVAPMRVAPFSDSPKDGHWSWPAKR